MSKITWKSQTEIDAKKNAPKPPTPDERISALEQAMMAVMGAK